MQLEQTSSNNTCTFLDLAINIENGSFSYKSYDKRKDFNFEIINYPDQGNVPQSPSYGVFTSQLIRFCDIISKLVHYRKHVELLVNKLIKQRFQSAKLKAKFLRFYAQNFLRWSKFGLDISNIADIC